MQEAVSPTAVYHTKQVQESPDRDGRVSAQGNLRPGSREMRMNAERMWQAALGQLQMELPRATFDTWVRDAELLAYEDGTFIVGVQNAYARDWLEDRMLSTVKRVLTGLAGRTIE